MKTINLLLMCLVTGLVACGNKTEDLSPAQTNEQKVRLKEISTTSVGPVELISRYNKGNYTTATYSFKYLTRDDVNLTLNNWELLFEGREDFEHDKFRVNTVVTDNSYIYDLGEKSCYEIKSTYPEGYKEEPLIWLAYSDADPSEMKPEREVNVIKGHCYLVYANDEDGRVVALFSVKDQIKSESVIIDEIQVLDRLLRD